MRPRPEPPPYGPRPKLRGVSHAIAAPLFALAFFPLLHGLTRPEALWGVGLLDGGLVLLFTISALYHRVEWTPRALGRMRRLDHAFIFVLIWCVYAPFCLMALPPAEGHRLLLVAGAGALLGVGRVLAWPYAPKPIAVTTYTMLPLLAAPSLTRIFAALGPFGTACMVAGNSVVALGALAYAYGRPDPVPDVFGSHEIFHLTVIGCAVAYTAAVACLARGWGM